MTLSCVRVSAQILEDRSLASAEVQKLKQEVEMLSTIQQGIKLSVAECELVESCSPTVSRVELDQIVAMLDTRVNTLSLRYSETTDAELEGVLLSYADMRDSYKQILGKMDGMPQFAAEQPEVADALATDDFFTAKVGGTGKVSAELMQLFRDEDEDLVDDVIDTPENPGDNPPQSTN